MALVYRLQYDKNTLALANEKTIDMKIILQSNEEILRLINNGVEFLKEIGAYIEGMNFDRLKNDSYKVDKLLGVGVNHETSCQLAWDI